MKKLLLLPLILLTLFSCTKEEIIDIDAISNPITEEPIETPPVDNPTEPPVDNNSPSIQVNKNHIFLDYTKDREHTFYTANSKQHFNIDGQEYFLYATDGWESFLFKRRDTIWELQSIENQTKIHGSFFTTYENNEFIIAGTGEHFWTDPTTWKDYIYKGKIQNDKVVYTKIVDVPMYHREPGYGNVGGDGNNSVVAGAWFFMNSGSEPYTPYFIGDVKPHGDVDPFLNQYKNNNFNIIDNSDISRVRNSVLTTRVFDIFDGGRDEIIHCFLDVSDRVSPDDTRAARGEVIIYEFSQSSNRYEKVFTLPRQPNGVENVESLQAHDVNNDGLKDLLLEIATGDPSLPQPFEVWINNGDKTFSLNNRFSISVDGFGTMGWKLMDINNDSYLDLIFQPFGGGEGFIQNWCTSDCGDRQQQGLPVKDGIKLHNAIYINSGNGSFNKIQNEIVIKDTYVEWLKAFMRDGNLCFFGSVYKYVDGVTMKIELVDIELKNYF